MPGERIENANGEVLCMTRDGVARHIGVDGREVFSTAYLTRGGKHPLRYHSSNGGLSIAGQVKWGLNQNKWSSVAPHQGLPRNAFHSFLNGPCKLIDKKADVRVNLYNYAGFGGLSQTVTCNAASTCGSSTRAPRSEAYTRARALTDADYGTATAGLFFFRAISSCFETQKIVTTFLFVFMFVLPCVSSSNSSCPESFCRKCFLCGDK